MSRRRDYEGAALAGTVLLAMPALDLLIGRGEPGMLHVLVALLGTGLLTAAALVRKGAPE